MGSIGSGAGGEARGGRCNARWAWPSPGLRPRASPGPSRTPPCYPGSRFVPPGPDSLSISNRKFINHTSALIYVLDPGAQASIQNLRKVTAGERI